MLRFDLDETYPGAEAAAGPQVDIVADCHALQVCALRVKAGQRRAFQTFRAASALVFHKGKGTVNIAGCSHEVAAGAVEIVCRGEACRIYAAQEIHAFLVLMKDQDA